jgi:hypothetical protein
LAVVLNQAKFQPGRPWLLTEARAVSTPVS